MSRMSRLALAITGLVLASCASAAPVAKDASKESPEQACSFTPKNCLPMSEDAFAECVQVLTARQGSACYPRLIALKECFATMSECDEAGELIENDNGMADCNYENGELEACCAAHPGDASCDI